MRPSLAWSRNSAPSLRAISRPARAASAWVGWTEVARSLPSRTTAHPSARERTWIGALSATPLEAGQGVREAAQGPLVLALLLVSLPLGLLGLGLGWPGLRSLLGLRLRLGLPLLGAALGLLGLVARQGAVGFFGLAYGFLRHIGLHSRVVLVALDAREGQDSYTPVRVWLPGAASRDPRKSKL